MINKLFPVIPPAFCPELSLFKAVEKWLSTQIAKLLKKIIIRLWNHYNQKSQEYSTPYKAYLQPRIKDS